MFLYRDYSEVKGVWKLPRSIRRNVLIQGYGTILYILGSVVPEYEGQSKNRREEVFVRSSV